VTEAVSISVAASHFDVSVDTVRRWIRDGAPCVSPGEVGRGHAATVCIADLTAWRARRLGIATPEHANVMERIETAILDVMRRDGGSGRPINVDLGIPGDKAALLLAHALNRIARALNAARLHD
jgi:hypothetical protein